MRGGRFVNSLRQLARQPVINTPLIRNAFELGHCVSKPMKQGCMSPPSKEKQYFLIGLASSMKQQSAVAAALKNKSFAAATLVKNSSSSAAAAMVEEEEKEVEAAMPENAAAAAVAPAAKDSSTLDQSQACGISTGYWGVKPEDTRSKIWNSFWPSENRIIEAEAGLDVNKHKNPENFSDQFARLAVTALRFPTFRSRYLGRAAMLETISGVPGMIGGMVLHCKSLRRVEHSGGWIKALMEEAENERMHLMTFMQMLKPSWQERALIFAAQAMFMNVYLVLYVVSPRFSHRMSGYFREETIQSYTQLIRDIDDGKIPNDPAPDVAIDYWRLPLDATLKDVLLVIRADDVHHRDINHFAADVYMQGHTLKDAPVDMLSATNNSFERTCAAPAY